MTRDAGAPALTAGQLAVLTLLCNHSPAIDGCLSAAEISFALGHRLRSWAKAPLMWLLAHGYVRQVGITYRNARTWDATDAGRRALNGGERE